MSVHGVLTQGTDIAMADCCLKTAVWQCHASRMSLLNGTQMACSGTSSYVSVDFQNEFWPAHGKKECFTAFRK